MSNAKPSAPEPDSPARERPQAPEQEQARPAQPAAEGEENDPQFARNGE